MKNKPAITVYNDFIEDYQKINAWTTYDSFPIKDIKMDVFSEKYAIIEIKYHGNQGNNSKFESIAAVFYSFMISYLNSINSNKLLFLLGEYGLKNRIRSYRGLFDKKIDSLEKEFDIGNEYSIMEGAVSINKENTNLIKSYLFDREKCFLLISEDNMSSEDFLIDSFGSIINKESYVVNYVRACYKYCNGNNMIIRECGDGGDQEFSWQFFINKKNVNHIRKEIETLLNIKN